MAYIPPGRPKTRVLGVHPDLGVCAQNTDFGVHPETRDFRSGHPKSRYLASCTEGPLGFGVFGLYLAIIPRIDAQNTGFPGVPGNHHFRDFRPNMVHTCKSWISGLSTQNPGFAVLHGRPPFRAVFRPILAIIPRIWAYFEPKTMDFGVHPEIRGMCAKS